MKKIFLSLILFLVIFLYKTELSFAQLPVGGCKPYAESLGCSGKTYCALGIGDVYCCNTPLQCADLKNNPVACKAPSSSLFGKFCTPPLHGCSVTQGGTYVACCPDQPSCTAFVDTYSATTNPTGNQDPTAACGGDGEKINSAIGCIPFKDNSEFLGWILGWAVGVGGGVAFLLIALATITIMTSQGNPDKVKEGQEHLTSAISGLILLIFTIFVLKFIGIDILGLNNFGFGN